MRADLFASAAPRAEIGKYHELRFETLRFRIAAPGAVQRTALEKHGCPQSRPVLGGHPLNIVYDAVHIHALLYNMGLLHGLAFLVPLRAFHQHPHARELSSSGLTPLLYPNRYRLYQPEAKERLYFGTLVSSSCSDKPSHVPNTKKYLYFSTDCITIDELASHLQ